MAYQELDTHLQGGPVSSTPFLPSGREMFPPSMRLTAIGATVVAAGLLCCLETADAKCDSSSDPKVDWDADKDRLVLTSGCATMSDIVGLLTVDGVNNGPVYHFSQIQNRVTTGWTGTYYLNANLFVENGATLSIDGDGSDLNECNDLFLHSSSSKIVNLRAHGGKLDIRNTRIVSWDKNNNDYHRSPGSKGRSHISAITEMITGRHKDTCPNESSSTLGRAKSDKGRAVMDIYRSEIAYLGYQGTEAYGISYKARGLCEDLSNLDIFDDDNNLDYGTTGDIIESNIHDNWFGHYSWGHNGGEWKYNKVHDNYGYGFDPHDDSDKVEILNNEVYNNGWHGIIASKRCNNVKIQNNEVYNNGQAGIMLHRSSNEGIVSNNNVYNNGDAGMALFESSDCTIYDNTFTNNKQGIRFSNGASSNRVYRNTIVSGKDSQYALYSYKGGDPQEAEGNDDGHNNFNKIFNNDIYSTQDHVWEIREADENIFEQNTVHSGKYGQFRYTYNSKVKGNVFPDGFYFDNDDESCFTKGGQLEPICS